MDSLLCWNKKPDADKTFTNLKIFMQEEYHALQEVGGLSVNNLVINQANIIKQLKDLQVHQNNIAMSLKEDLSANIM